MNNLYFSHSESGNIKLANEILSKINRASDRNPIKNFFQGCFDRAVTSWNQSNDQPNNDKIAGKAIVDYCKSEGIDADDIRQWHSIQCKLYRAILPTSDHKELYYLTSIKDTLEDNLNDVIDKTGLNTSYTQSKSYENDLQSRKLALGSFQELKSGSLWSLFSDAMQAFFPSVFGIKYYNTPKVKGLPFGITFNIDKDKPLQAAVAFIVIARHTDIDLAQKLCGSSQSIKGNFDQLKKARLSGHTNENITKLENIANQLIDILGGINKQGHSSTNQKGPGAINLFVDAYQLDRQLWDAKNKANEKNIKTIYGAKKYLNALNAKLNQPVTPEKKASINKAIKETQEQLRRLYNNIWVLLNKPANIDNGTVQYSTMSSLMARVARVNNFACTGRWFCPECGKEMKSSKHCDYCGANC